MKREAWLAINRAAIERRLQWLHDRPPGVLFFEPTEDHIVVVDKTESQLRLWLADPTSDLVQSRLELDDPLYLVSPYSQAALLGLIWRAQPDRACVIGLGGGRIPLVLHHYLPDTRIECAEIDPVVIQVAARFFGLEWDDRLEVVRQDGRDYLAGLPQQVKYDLLLIDAFGANGDGPYRLATREFYTLCQAHLAEGGVVIANLLHHDSFFAEKVNTIRSMFERVYLWPPGQGNSLLFASNGPALSQAGLIERAQAVQEFFAFPFPFVERVAELKMGPAIGQYVPGLDRARFLTDAGPVSADPASPGFLPSS